SLLTGRGCLPFVLPECEARAAVECGLIQHVGVGRTHKNGQDRQKQPRPGVEWYTSWNHHRPSYPPGRCEHPLHTPLHLRSYFSTRAIHSISTRALRGSSATATVERAGAWP